MLNRSQAAGDVDARRDLAWRLVHHRMAQQKGWGDLEPTSGLTATELIQIELGERDVTFPELTRLCDALDLPVVDFLGAEIPRVSRTHPVTVQSSHWHTIDAGVQHVDIRRNTGPFRVGDRLAMQEVLGHRTTERILTVEIVHLVYGERYGLVPGTVVLDVRVVRDPSS